MSTSDDPVMNEGDAVILYSAKKKFNSCILNPSKSIRVFGVKKNLGALVGQPYGSVYELLPGPGDPKRIHELTEQSNVAMISEGRDNRDVMDLSANQKLSMDDIEDMKQSCQNGAAIVEALVENSETFESKTEFAQEKYLSKKQKKYCTTFSALRPSSTTICEAQFDWFAVKTSFLRVDNLALILSLANIGPYRRVLVVDNCLGMLIGAIAERMGGFGDLVVGDIGKRPSRFESLRWFPQQLQQSFEKHPFHELGKMEPCSERIQRVRNLGFDCCVLSDWKVHPSALIQVALPLLSASSHFVIFSSGLPALIECQVMLRSRSDVVMVELQELNWREYQVLPGRTRPEMDGKVSGGYILSGIKVEFQQHHPEEQKEGKKPHLDNSVIS
eukprot:g3690.t1